MGTALRSERSDPVTAYVALGANLGDAAATVSAAMDALACLPLTEVAGRSSLYQTAPMGDVGALGEAPRLASGGDYINAVVALRTTLTAPELLRQLQVLENAAGRTRPYLNAPRTLDLDLLLYGSGRIDSAKLTVPHPRMTQRAFVLVPLHEIAPELTSARQLEAVTNQVIKRLGQMGDAGVAPTRG